MFIEHDGERHPLGLKESKCVSACVLNGGVDAKDSQSRFGETFVQRLERRHLCPAGRTPGCPQFGLLPYLQLVREFVRSADVASQAVPQFL